VIVARHMGIRVLAISCVTNMAAGITGEPITHEEVLETGARVRRQFVALLRAVIPHMAKDLKTTRD
jgi:purine-nucleoside phosphorylase